MQLSSYLKQFKNIAWYPSAGKDSLAMVCLSYESLKDYGISKEEAPDCFIFTDYETYADQVDNRRFFLDLEENEGETSFCYKGSDFTATAHNIRELDRLRIPFDQELVAFKHDYYYGRVFIADVSIEHSKTGKNIAKLVYIIAENTAFAFDYLIKRNIKIKYVIHSRYGHGFGGGISNGAFICNILKDLGTTYFASDINFNDGSDVANKYLTETQRSTNPVFRLIDNFAYKYGWCGYDDVILYRITGFDIKKSNI